MNIISLFTVYLLTSSALNIWFYCNVTPEYQHLAHILRYVFKSFLMNILMVCLGNICRSPLAHGILQAKVEALDLPWTVDSAGTGNWHVGEKPDHRSILEARKHGLDITYQRARHFTKDDFEKFDLILAMDTQNYNDIIRQAPHPSAIQKVKMIMDYVAPSKNISVPDPYYDNRFALVYEMLDEAIHKLIIAHTECVEA